MLGVCPPSRCWGSVPLLDVGGLSPFSLGFFAVPHVRYRVEKAPGLLAPVLWTPLADAQNLEADHARIELPLAVSSNQVLRAIGTPWP